MKSVIFAIACLFFLSCSKKDQNPGDITKDPNNHLEAVVTFTNGNTVTINETGQNVKMGNSWGGYFANAINSQNQGVNVGTSSLNFNGSNFNECHGSYYPNGIPGDVEYRSNNIAGDTLIYTVISGSHREGNFRFRCVKAPGDTVRITGSFKGRFGL